MASEKTPGNPAHHLGELQHAIMSVLWERSEATVAEVREALSRLPGRSRDRALTTVATMLAKMERKGVVAHRVEGRQFVYRPIVSEDQVARAMVADLTERLFEGDFARLVSHLLTRQEIEPSELEHLRRLIAEQGALEGAMQEEAEPEMGGDDAR
jgi:predicted transcriptional regulator